MTLGAFFAPRRKAGDQEKTGAVHPRASQQSYRGAAVPAGWVLEHGCLLVRQFGEPPASTTRLVAFDFDDTLCPNDYSRPEPEHWAHLYRHAPAHVRGLVASGAGLAVLSNECLDRLKNVDVLRRKLKNKCGRIDRWAEDVGVPVLCLVALTKKDADDPRKFHKSRGAGMWTRAFEALGVATDSSAASSSSSSYYVGDSKDDAALAAAAAVPFHHVRDYFTRLHPPPP